MLFLLAQTNNIRHQKKKRQKKINKIKQKETIITGINNLERRDKKKKERCGAKKKLKSFTFFSQQTDN